MYALGLTLDPFMSYQVEPNEGGKEKKGAFLPPAVLALFCSAVYSGAKHLFTWEYPI